MAITVTKKQRRRIRAIVLTDLSAVGDIDLALRNGEWDFARRLWRDCQADLRLLDDLGWYNEPPAEPIQLTMSELDLTRTIARLHAGVIGAAWDAARAGERSEVGRDAKDAGALSAVLAQLGPAAGASDQAT